MINVIIILSYQIEYIEMMPLRVTGMTVKY
jgi:hypothetical protein